jgi:hypothetical protein
MAFELYLSMSEESVFGGRGISTGVWLLGEWLLGCFFGTWDLGLGKWLLGCLVAWDLVAWLLGD